MLGIFFLFVLVVALVGWYNKTKTTRARNFNYSVDDRYNLQKLSEEEEIDRILEKINKKGMASLTQKEKEKLEQYSRMEN